MDECLDVSLIQRSLNFHGQQLQKLWETEQGENHLSQLNITDLNFQEYSQRQKHLLFQERGKRLQLHEFIAKNASRLFHKDLNVREEIRPIEQPSETDKPNLPKYAELPPFELFLNLDSTKRVQHFYEFAKVGDLIVGLIQSRTIHHNRNTNSRRNRHVQSFIDSNIKLIIKVLYLESDVVFCVPDLNIKTTCTLSSSIEEKLIKESSKHFEVNDYVRGRIIEIVPHKEKIILTFLSSNSDQVDPHLGHFKHKDFDSAYRVYMEYNKKDSFSETLEKSSGFYNPKNVDNLSNDLQLGDKTPSHFLELKNQVSESETAPDLRQQQTRQLSMNSVADGISYFKSGKFPEAFQCLNKALSIEPQNVEGLTARGALYANNGNYSKAIADFEAVLKTNPSHFNARKYLGQTLVARGKSLEEENKFDEAMSSYEACLKIVPFLEEATRAIQLLKQKMNGGETDLTSNLPPLNIGKVSDVKATLKQLLAQEKEKEVKKRKEKKKRKRQSSSSSSDSSSDMSSSDSSVSSSSSDSSQDSATGGRKKKKKKKNKERSLSPLSKRMAGTTQGNGVASRTYNPASSSNLMGIFDSVAQNAKSNETEYDLRVSQFLEQTKGDNDYEEKVRKFLEETAKWKKEQRLKEKKKRKKEKKSKDKVKKKKKEEKRKRKLEEKKLKENELRSKTGLSVLGVSELATIQSKISEFYSRMNKPPSPSPVKKKETVEKSSSKKSKIERSPPTSEDEAEEEEASPPRKPPPPAKRSSTNKSSNARSKSRSVSVERKKVDIFAASPPSKNDRSEPSSSSKFKMQISSKNKRDSKGDKDVWSDEEDDRRYDSKKEKISTPVVERHKPVNVGVDKLSGLRMNLDAAKKKRKESRSDDSESEKDDKKRRRVRKRETDSSSRSRSRKRSRSRSRSRSSSSSYSNKRSYRKRYRSSDSRSRSRSERSRSRSYSHSRSRSYSPRASRGHHRGQGRGTYYKPRPYYHNPRGTYVPRGRGRGYVNHRGGYDNFRGHRGGGGYVPRGRGSYHQSNYNNGHSRPRYFHYKPRDSSGYYNSRYEGSNRYEGGGGRYEKRPRSPRDDDRDEESPMRKVNAEKQRIDRVIDKHPSGPLSEGEERDDEDGELH